MKKLAGAKVLDAATSLPKPTKPSIKVPTTVTIAMDNGTIYMAQKSKTLKNAVKFNNIAKGVKR